MISYRKRLPLKSQKRRLLKRTFSRVPKRSRQRSFSFKFKFLRAVLAIILLVLFYFIFLSPYFQIKKTIVIDLRLADENKIEEIAESILDKRRFLIFPGENIFIFNKHSIRTSILENVTEVDNVEIIRKYPNILKIKVEEAKPRALWKSREEYYYLDGEGSVRGKIEDPSIFNDDNIFTIVDQNNKEVNLKESVVYAKHLNFIKVLYEKLPQLNIGIKEIILPSALADEIHVRTDKDWRIFFILDREVENQISNLQLVLEKEITGKIAEEDLDYIDIRLESWIYYREKKDIPVKESTEDEEGEEKEGEEDQEGQSSFNLE